MSAISTIRHNSIFNSQENNVPISIIGCGATGSRVFMALIELGLTHITCFDDDIVEAHNLANQAFTYKHLGQLKVAALEQLYREKTGHAPPGTMQFIAERVPGSQTKPTGIVFLLTDTMSSRREIIETLDLTLAFHVIETRMASTHGNVYCFTPSVDNERKAWLATLIDDSEGETSPCGGSISVGTTASIIANLAVWQMMHFLTNPAAQDQVVDIFLQPFCTSTRKL